MRSVKTITCLFIISCILCGCGEKLPVEGSSESDVNVNYEDMTYAKAVKYHEEQKYENAITWYRKVSENDVSYDAAQIKLKECSRIYLNTLLAECEECAARGDYEVAVARISLNSTYLEESELKVIETKREEYLEAYIAKLTQTIDGYFESADFMKCAQLIFEAKTYIGDDESLKDIEDKVLVNYEAYAKSVFDTAITTKNLDEGIEQLEQLLLVFPDNRVVNDLRSKIEKYYPLALADMKPNDSKCNGRTIEKPAKDTYQNEYDNATRIWAASTFDNYVVYSLNKEYKWFSCTITPSEKWTKSSYAVEPEYQVIVWGDDIKLYERSFIRTDRAEKIEFSVEGIDTLKITFDRVSGYTDAYFLLADAYLHIEY